ncbi:MAG TPA: DinB family protein [Ktedonobacteraceae bacterium]
MRKIEKPAVWEFVPYALEYVKLVPDDGLVLQHLQNNLLALHDLVGGLAEEKLSTPCAEGEWTIKEILVHVTDTERIFAYRALRFARNDTTSLPGFEQDDYVAASGANQRSLKDILAELSTVRAATIALFNSLSEEAFDRAGLSSGNKLSVRSALYIIAGHELHHVKSIKENYLQ